MTRGLLMVNTGDGKGKTTAAIGALMRAWGHGLKVAMIQFIKHENAHFGEIKAARKIGIEWNICGDGFVMPGQDSTEAMRRVKEGWKMAQVKISSGAYDLIVLDEFTYALHFGWLNTKEVLQWIQENKPSHTHLMITGRSAPQELVEAADLVTEMTMIKHPYEQGIPAQLGIEF